MRPVDSLSWSRELPFCALFFLLVTVGACTDSSNEAESDVEELPETVGEDALDEVDDSGVFEGNAMPLSGGVAETTVLLADGGEGGGQLLLGSSGMSSTLFREDASGGILLAGREGEETTELLSGTESRDVLYVSGGDVQIQFLAGADGDADTLTLLDGGGNVLSENSDSQVLDGSNPSGASTAALTERAQGALESLLETLESGVLQRLRAEALTLASGDEASTDEINRVFGKLVERVQAMIDYGKAVSELDELTERPNIVRVDDVDEARRLIGKFDTDDPADRQRQAEILAAIRDLDQDLETVVGGDVVTPLKELTGALVDGDGFEVRGDGEAPDLRVRLRWNADVDLDLLMRTPEGTEVSEENPAADGGELDPVNEVGGANAYEEILFRTAGPGEYKMLVRREGDIDTEVSARYELALYINGILVGRDLQPIGSGADVSDVLRVVVDEGTDIDCVDEDNDGYGVGTDCLGADCDDSRQAVHQNATEVCDGEDNDCDGDADEDFRDGQSGPYNQTIQHCGGCGIHCADELDGASGSASTCSPEGVCEISVCAQGYFDCDGDPSGCEVDGTDDDENCGGCGIDCTALGIDYFCADSQCEQTACNPGFATCSGDTNVCETDLTSDFGNCGSCGATCAGSVANGSAACDNESLDPDDGCVIDTCNTGFGDCDGQRVNGCETNLETSSDCGSCGNTCAGGLNSSAACDLSGVIPECSVTCNEGYADCNADPSDGCESDATVPSTCGEGCVNCDDLLSGPEQHVFLYGCDAQLGCEIASCEEGWDDCNTYVADGCEEELNSVANCGSCGLACPDVANAVPVCDSFQSFSECSFVCDDNFYDCNEDPSDGCEAENGCG